MVVCAFAVALAACSDDTVGASGAKSGQLPTKGLGSGNAGASGGVTTGNIVGNSSPPTRDGGTNASGVAGRSLGASNAGLSGGSGITGSAAAPPPSGYPDVTLEMNVKVPAGAELLKCLYAALPGDRGVIAVPSAESHYTPGSHHFLVYRSDLIGVPAGQTAVYDCNDGDFTHNKGSYYEAQQPDSRRDLPQGVAQKFQPNEVVIMQSHYVNTTTNDVDAHLTFILHTMDPAQVQHEAASILWSNNSIFIPAHSKTRVTMACPISSDFNPAILWSHMHSRSSNFVATTDDPAAAAALGTLYAEPNWAEPQPREYPADPPVTLHMGTHVTFSCDIDNDTDSIITYGQSAQTNEMCILHGMYWPKMTQPGAASCFGGMTSTTQL